MRVSKLAQLGFLLLLGACGGRSPVSSTPPAPGSLQLAVQGIPAGESASISVQGPSGFDHTLSGSSVLEALEVGTYTLSAQLIQTAQGDYTPTPSWQQIEVEADRRSYAQVNYAPPSTSSLDLSIAAVYLVQSVQRPDGSVPLIAGRDALLRVFVVANEATQASPQVRVTLYDGQSSPLTSYVIEAGGNGVPNEVDQSDLDLSWNQTIPAQYLLPGLRLVVEADPANAVAEASEANNRWPASGSKALDVRAIDDLQLRFVPVRQVTTGLTGDVSNANAEEFLQLARKLWPTADYAYDVRGVYTTTAPALQSDDSNGAWGSILSEIWALRQAESPVGARHYYGVVDVSYGSGIAGMAYLANYAGIGRDLAYPGLQVVFPHELGHNLSLPHAACGVSGGDPDYPYPNGQIGVFGFDAEQSAIKAPDLVDVMSYCNDVWISDYNFELALDWRMSAPKRPMQQVGAEIEPCLLVWGSVHDGGIELRPVVELDARAALPSGGSFEIEIDRADGERRSLRFDPIQLGDGGRPGERHFAWLLPRADFLGSSELDALIVRGEGHGAALEPAPVASPAPAELSRDAEGLWIRWDAASRPLMVVRDAEHGEILSFATGGALRLTDTPARIELILSDGARSERQLEQLR